MAACSGCSLKRSYFKEKAAKPGEGVRHSVCPWEARREEQRGPGATPRVLSPNNMHPCRESHGQGDSRKPCLWGSVRRTFPSPPMCSHMVTSRKERGAGCSLPIFQDQVQPATWLTQGGGCDEPEQEAWGPGTWHSLPSRQGTKLSSVPPMSQIDSDCETVLSGLSPGAVPVPTSCCLAFSPSRHRRRPPSKAPN